MDIDGTNPGQRHEAHAATSTQTTVTAATLVIAGCACLMASWSVHQSTWRGVLLAACIVLEVAAAYLFGTHMRRQHDQHLR